MTVIENIMVAPMELRGMNRQAAYDNAKNLLKSVGLLNKSFNYPNEFAKEISNRVLYMDEGGIYEDGTPQQIFDNPKRDKTRQFIKCLKVLELTISSHDFDFLEINTLIEEFAIKNDIAPKMRNALLSLFEELCLQIILPVLENPNIKILIEYSKADESSTFNIKYNGKKFDINDTTNDIALSIVKGRASNFEYQFVDGNELSNNLVFKVISK